MNQGNIFYRGGAWATQKAQGVYRYASGTKVWRNFAKEGWRPFAQSFIGGVGSTFGLAENAAAEALPVMGKLRWAGGAYKTGLKGLGYGTIAGVGIGLATGNTNVGVLAGAFAAGHVTGFGFGKMLMPAFGVQSFIEGYKREGLWGGAKSLGSTAIQWGVFDTAIKAVSVATRGTAIGALGSTALRIVMNPVTAILAATVYAGYKGADYIAGIGRGSQVAEFAGSMEAFQTGAAYTMRQRAVQEIARSHTSSRVVLGQEAMLMHL